MNQNCVMLLNKMSAQGELWGCWTPSMFWSLF